VIIKYEKDILELDGEKVIWILETSAVWLVNLERTWL